MGKSQAEHRLKLLFQHRYIRRPNRRQRLMLPEMICWLDKRGAELVASRQGLELKELGWREEPRWLQVEHDLAVVDFRLDLEEAVGATVDVGLETWVPESEFWAYPDRVAYEYHHQKMHRKMRPDGYFMLGTPDHRIRYLLEIDRSTEDNPRFYREKILPGLAYVRSEAYAERFGYKGGRWLVVTTGERRLANMLRQAEKASARGLFYFTTYDRLSPSTLLFEPIWQRADRDEPVPLLRLD
jgi:hypothetical protein